MSEAPEVFEEEEEIEGGETGQLTTLDVKDQVILWEQVAANAEKMIVAKKKIWGLILSIAKPGDWMVFESNGRRKASVGFAGALRIASMIGISFTDWSKERVTGKDEKGEFYRYDMECTAFLGNRKIRVYGRAGSRDSFFGVKGGEFKELYDINEGNIRAAAWHNTQKEGVKALLGLHAIPPEELEAAGVSLENAGSYAFKEKTGPTPTAPQADAQTVNIKVNAVTVKTTKTGKKVYVINGTEGDKFDTFSETFANIAKAAGIDDSLLTVHYTTNKYGNAVTNVEVVKHEPEPA